MDDTTELQHRILALKVQECIANKNKEMLASLLEDMSKNKRKIIVDHEIQGKSALFLACELEEDEIVKYLVEKCDANVEQKGLLDDAMYNVHVTPLWMAAERGSFDVVKCLIENGASCNNMSQGGLSPLMAACQSDSADIVYFLCEHGADVNNISEAGDTCLRKAAGNPELCKFFISQGSDVNQGVKGQYPILHLGIKSKHLDSVKELLRAGADPESVDFEGNDALQFAAMVAAVDIVHYLIEMLEYNKDRISKTYRLLGACAIAKEDIDTGVELWEKVIASGGSDLTRESPLNAIYRGVTEPKTLSDLDELKKCNNDLSLASLIVLEKILGKTHGETIHQILMYGTALSYDEIGEDSTRIILYAYDLLREKHSGLHRMTEYALSQVVRCLFDIYRESIIDEDIDTSSLHQLHLEVLSRNVDFVAKSQTEIEHNNGKEKQSMFSTLLENTLNVIFLFSGTELSEDEDEKYESLLSRLVRTNPHDWENRNLLHLALSRKLDRKIIFLMSQGSRNWYVYLTEVLLLHGVDVNDRDNEGNTPFHVSADLYTKNCFEREIKLFLDAGGHVDAVNNAGKTVLDCLRESGKTVCEVRHTSLKCLASRAVVRYRISLPRNIPKHAMDLLNIHGLKA
ncbi:protein fem-1 homolog C-like [Saccostrea echinata]|uniref:protein fem-1 homolog C-like n=1 Tax=Saccostrea echinata TaxID=191078 RepID=UPI002A834E3E|nr:protein fem-1 homolog C-like [Saccostrea echinata]